MTHADDSIAKYRHLWDGTDPDWVVLIRDNDPKSCLPYNVRTRTVLAIEDDERAEAVIQKMLESGVPRAGVQNGEVIVQK